MKKRIFSLLFILLFGLVIHIIISVCDVELEIAAKGKTKPDSVTSSKKLPISDTLLGIHMVNSPKKHQKNYSKFKHFELDAFFVNDNFYIAHDKEEICDLTLFDMLFITDSDKSYVWLDLKNEIFELKMVEKLNETLNKTGFTKEQFIIEASPEIIKELSREGFYTAFTPGFNKKMSVPEREELAKEVKKTIIETGAAALEGNVAQYPFLRDAFPEMDKIIHFARPYVKVRKKLFAKKLSQDPKVKFFIVEDN